MQQVIVPLCLRQAAELESKLRGYGHKMKVRPFQPRDKERVAELIAEFRVALGELRGEARAANIGRARDELADYRGRGYPIFVAESEDSRIVGYVVCRVDEHVVWAESLFVSPEYRRRGIGSALYSEAERLAREVGGDTVYNWVHPNNDKIISFLTKRGYNVLNLIELRRPRSGEGSAEKIRVGKHEFDY